MNQLETPQLTPLQKVAAGRKLIEAEIVSRAWADDAFRAKLQADPVSALAEAGIPIPEGKTIRVIPEEPGTTVLVLTPSPQAAAETSDDELAAVAGGAWIHGKSCKGAQMTQDGYDRGKLNKFEVGVAIVGFAFGALTTGYSALWD